MLLFSLAAAGAESAVDTILTTGTTQAFSSEAVPEEDIRTILQAGVSTASAINQQPWYFVAITNQDVMKEIGGSGMSFGGKPGAAPEGMTPPDGASIPAAGEKPEGEMPAMPAMPAGSCLKHLTGTTLWQKMTAAIFASDLFW